MSIEDARHLSEILKAYSEGKIVEVNGPDAEWRQVGPSEKFDQLPCYYRIKPDLRLRPYSNFDEFFKAQKEHGPYIQFSDKVYNIPKTVHYIGGLLVFDFETPAYQTLNSKDLLKYHWQDGTVCGVVS